MANKTQKIQKYALISVYEKSSVIELVKKLVELGYGIIASEGTGCELKKLAIPFDSCGEISGNPKCFDGFMKTLSFPIEGGIIYDRSNQMHREEALKYGIRDIDVVVCNFFPVNIAKEKFKSKSEEEVVRYMDFGGPIMVRTAAMNYKNVLVVVDPADYAIINNVKSLAEIQLEDRKKLALKALEYIQEHDDSIIKFLDS